jgi:hypothetical protein
MQPDMAPYGHFLLKAHKETKVPHTPELQYIDPYHCIRNSMHSHSRVCNYLQIPSESSLVNISSHYSSDPWNTNWLLRNNAPDASDFMTSRLSKFFDKMTNAFPPSISWFRNQIFKLIEG